MSTKGRLAVNALLDLALREGAGPVALASISERQQVSLSYLEQMFSRLRRQGVVESTRGPGGGYTLGRDANAITVAEIVSTVDEADDSEPRTGVVDAVSAQLWRQAETVMLDYLATVSLQSLVDEQRARGTAVEPPSPRRVQTSSEPAVTVSALPLRCRAPNSVFAFGQSFGG